VVDAIWRFPLKSAQGESVASAYFGSAGPDGDRSWACVTQADGLVVSAKNPRRFGRILSVTATMASEGRGADVLVEVPGREPVLAGTPEADEALSGWLGEPVRLTSEVPPNARLHRLWSKEPGMIPDWAKARPGDDEVGDVAGAVPGGRFVDFAAVHVVTTTAMAELARECPAADVRRLRPNLVLDLDREPEPGERIQAGPEVVLRVMIPTPRCVIPSVAQPGLAHSSEVLRAIARRRAEIPGLGKGACFGTYAEVLQAGTITVGDTAAIAC
jgi:uncharacterized protein